MKQWIEFEVCIDGAWKALGKHLTLEEAQDMQKWFSGAQTRIVHVQTVETRVVIG